MNPPMYQGPRFRLPEPVDVDNPTWVGRAWQAVFDALNHLDSCQDKTRGQVVELDTSLKSWMTAAATSDESLGDRIKEHILAHQAIEDARKTRKGVWLFQWRVLEQTGKIVGSGAAAAVFVFILRTLGLV